jgi:hypothetical protein
MTGRPAGMPPDWRPPDRVLIEKAWNEHPEQDRLVELDQERDDEGVKQWELYSDLERGEPEWTAVWLQPVDPDDERLPIRISRYPNAWREGERSRALDQAAIDAEHFNHPE